MTVCVAISVHDCIVFAADSATSLTRTTPYGTSKVNNVWKHGLKVFNLHKDFPIVAMTTGMANFGTMSITNLTKELRMKLMEDLCVETYTRKEVARCSDRYFHDEYRKTHAIPVPDHSFEFWIGGYCYDNRQGENWKLAIRHGQWLSPARQLRPEASNQSLATWLRPTDRATVEPGCWRTFEISYTIGGYINARAGCYRPCRLFGRHDQEVFCVSARN